MPSTRASSFSAVPFAAPMPQSTPRAIALAALERYDESSLVCDLLAIQQVCNSDIDTDQQIAGFQVNAIPLLTQFVDIFHNAKQAGLCCVNVECCAKLGAPCLFPCGCVGIRPECDGCSIINAQCHACCVVASAAVPCNKEVPVAVSVAGITLFPKFGCCVRQKEIMQRD